MFPLSNPELSVKTNKPLVVIKRNCDNQHKHCNDIVQNAYTSIEPITQEYFNSFLSMINASKYSSCLSQNCNKKHSEIKKFITTHSANLLIDTNNWNLIGVYMSDYEICDILINQRALESNLFLKLIDLEITLNNYYSNKISFLNLLIYNIIKTKSFEHILMNMNLNEFSKYIDKIWKNYSNSSNYSPIDAIIIKFIQKHKNVLKLETNNDICVKIIKTFITKPNIIKEIYPIASNINTIQKKEIFNKSILTFDKNLIILMLEKKDIIPDIETVKKLIEKSYVRSEGASNSHKVAQIIDLLCEYGLVITKEIVLTLLERGCYINNFEKHGMVVDNIILSKCAELSYYPYKFDIVPNTDILKKECSKPDNLNTIKKLKEYGGIYTPECLEESCSISKNGKVIKYLVNDCGVKITDQCLEKFQQAYRIEALDVLMKKYKIQNPISKNELELDKEKKYIELNDKAIMTINPRKIKNNENEININDNNIEYELKNKVRKFFELKKKTIKYKELYEIFLKYIISNKLVIGKYFVINIELSNLLKISHCVIMNTNQIHNILTYFINPPLSINDNTNISKVIESDNNLNI